MTQNRVWIKKLNTSQKLKSLESFFPHDAIDTKQVQTLLKQYSLKKIIRGKKTDFDKALAIAEWVSKRWKHSGMPKNLKKYDALALLKYAQKGYSFSCVQFASLFVQCCHSLGIAARSIQVNTKHPDLGDSGQAHLTSEYFDNDLKKWVWIDAQIHCYAKKGKRLLNYFELSEELKAKNSSVVKFTKRSLDYVEGNKARFKDIVTFLGTYTGSIIIGVTKESSCFYNKQSFGKKCYLLPNSKPFCSFQDFPMKALDFIKYEDFYAEINNCKVMIESLNTLGTPKFKDLEDYKKNKSKYFCEKKVRLHLDNNMPWFKNYEIDINGKQKKTKKSQIDINLKSGENKVVVTPVNSFGMRGESQALIICFDKNFKKVKSFW